MNPSFINLSTNETEDHPPIFENNSNTRNHDSPLEIVFQQHNKHTLQATLMFNEYPHRLITSCVTLALIGGTTPL